MKNLFILLFLLFSIQAFTQIKTGGTLELGYEDRTLRGEDGSGNVWGSSWLNKKEFADIHLNASYKKLSIYTDVKTYFESEKLYRYNPVQIEYSLGLNYQIKCLEFGWRHLCSHSIEGEFFHEAYDRFSVRIKLW